MKCFVNKINCDFSSVKIALFPNLYLYAECRVITVYIIKKYITYFTLKSRLLNSQ